MVFLCLVSFVRPSAVFADPVAISVSAPADEYFGPYHVSVLGIRNVLHDLDSRGPDESARVYGKLVSVDLAVDDWRAHYPADPWIPGIGLHMARLYLRLTISDAARRAAHTEDWLIANYPTTDEARIAAHLRAGDADDSDPNEPVAVRTEPVRLTPPDPLPSCCGR